MSSGASTVDSVPEILKSIWDDEVRDFQYEDAPLYAMMEKDTGWDGLQQIVTVKYGGQGGRSHTFDSAQANKGPNRFKKMQIETADNFALWSVDNKLITLSRNQRGALVRALADATEGAQTKFKRCATWELWRDGGGAVGKIAGGGIAGSTITLANKNDIRNFDLGDKLSLSADSGLAGGGIEVGALLEVDEIDEDAGTLHCTAGIVATVATAVAGMFIFHAGDYGTALSGVPAYVTMEDPGSGDVPTSIWGMDRSDHMTRLAGHRFTAGAGTTAEEIQIALTKAFRRSCKVSHLFMAPETFTTLSQELEQNRRYADVTIGKVGFTGIEIVSQGGKSVKCFGDPDVPQSPNDKAVVFGLAMDGWKLHSAEDYPMWLTSDGKKGFLTEASANQREGRIGGYANAYTNAPGDNFVLELAA